MPRQKDLFTQHSPMDLLRAKRDSREKMFGPTLDIMPAEELLALCQYLFPEWPKPFGRKRFTLEAARQDKVIRRLLLAALEASEGTS